MQKFVVKKISRSTNITIAASEDQSLLPCGESKPHASEDVEVSSIKMSGYLKKKRNVSFGKWPAIIGGTFEVTRSFMRWSITIGLSNRPLMLRAMSLLRGRLINFHYFQRVGGWNKLYFVLQNSLLMSYNSREEYEKKLVSFKDVICLIPGNTVLLPSLEPRFTIASNLNTFYTFVSDDAMINSIYDLLRMTNHSI